ncbi:hypothetical protein [Streptomyces sp. NPDC088762]|uniref:AbiJ-related protein n=1 Tax=Streptomyces sp. NPDC088762 TaxID=3365891 RepID=UPI00380437CE
MFLEGLASATVLPDEQAQRRFVELADRHLQPPGAVLSQDGEADGYPQFHLVQHGRGTKRRPPRDHHEPRPARCPAQRNHPPA